LLSILAIKKGSAIENLKSNANNQLAGNSAKTISRERDISEYSYNLFYFIAKKPGKRLLIQNYT
jgi:hypothetical protein